jgi:hypothetical protein
MYRSWKASMTGSALANSSGNAQLPAAMFAATGRSSAIENQHPVRVDPGGIDFIEVDRRS